MIVCKRLNASSHLNSLAKHMQNYKEINGVNSLAAIEDRLRKGTLSRVGVIAMTPARAVYSYLAQFLVIALLFIAGNAHPYESSLGWWTVWGTAVDIACLVTLTLLVRREGIRLFDLVGGDAVPGKAR